MSMNGDDDKWQQWRDDPLHKAILRRSRIWLENDYQGFYFNTVLNEAHATKTAHAVQWDIVRAIHEHDLGEPLFPAGEPYFTTPDGELIDAKRAVAVGKPTRGYVLARENHLLLIDHWLRVLRARAEGAAMAHNFKADHCMEMIPAFSCKLITKIPKHPLLVESDE